jgi:hypothetical protein
VLDLLLPVFAVLHAQLGASFHLVCTLLEIDCLNLHINRLDCLVETLHSLFEVLFFVSILSLLLGQVNHWNIICVACVSRVIICWLAKRILAVRCLDEARKGCINRRNERFIAAAHQESRIQLLMLHLRRLEDT